MLKDIMIKMETSFLIEKRLKKIESVKFDNNLPNYFKKVFIKDCEEYISILKSISDYTTTAKNLAYIIVFHKIWTNKEFDNARLIEIFDTIISDITLSQDDRDEYEIYKLDEDLANMSLIINKYKIPDTYTYVSIQDRVTFNGEYSDLYLKVYNYINDFLDDFILNIELHYNEYVTLLNENQPGIEPISFDDYKKSLTINVSQILNKYYEENI